MSNQQYTYDESFFEAIDTEEKAYWLGFIQADGCLNRSVRGFCTLSVELEQGDRAHLEKFLKSLKSDVPIGNRERGRISENGKSVRLSSGFRVHSRKIFDDLVKLGIEPRKSLTTQFLKVQPSLMRHYIRGLVDGDGCLKVTPYSITLGLPKDTMTMVINLCGTEAVVSGAQQFIVKELGLKPGKIHRPGGSVYLITWGSIPALKLMIWLYSDATVYLDRKHSLYQQSLEVASRKTRKAWGQFDFPMLLRNAYKPYQALPGIVL